MPAGGIVEFDVLRDGSPMGSHRLDFRREGDRLIVEIKIDLEVRFLLPLYRYTHRSREVWQGGRLVQIDTTTDDDGAAFRVAGRAMGDGFAVESTAGKFVAPADVMPTSYWNRQMLHRGPLLDTQEGKLITTDIAVLPEESVFAGGRAIAARPYDISGDLTLRAWYDAAGDWVKLRFDVRGTRVDYVLRQSALSAVLLAPAFTDHRDTVRADAHEPGN